MAQIAYALCAGTSLICFGLLLRGYLTSRVKLLFWSSLSFFFLAVQNVTLFIDLVIVPQTDLSPYRTIAGFIGSVLLLFALIWENK